MKGKKVFLLVLLAFIMITPASKADFWSKLRDSFLKSSSGSSSSSRDKNIVDGKILNPRDKREYRLIEKIDDEKRYSENIYRNFERSSKKVFYYECTVNPRDFLSIIGYRTFYGYADFPVYEIGAGIEECYEKRENEYKRKVSARKIYLDKKLAMYIWKNEISVEKIGIYDAKLNDGNYPLFDLRNSRVLINNKMLSQ